MTTTLSLPLSPEVESAIKAAQAKAHEYHQAVFSPAHLLWGVLREDTGLHPFLGQLGKDVFRLVAWAEMRIENAPKAARPIESPVADERAQAVLQEAYRLRSQRMEAHISALSVLEALATPEIGFTAEQLKRFPLTAQEIQAGRQHRAEIFEALGEALAGADGAAGHKTADDRSPNPARALEKYCEDLTARARQGRVDPVIGRDTEMKKLVEILSKRLSPNVLIVGEPGVGKTAVVGGLALNIIAGKVPARLREAPVFELDVSGRLVAGAYKGEVEARLKEVLQGLKNTTNAILFIDEIHTLLDPNGPVGTGAANLLKPELARGDLTVVGATTEAEYRTFFEGDAAFKRRFTVLRIEEPTEDIALEMLRGLAPRYEAFHKIALHPDAPALAVQAAKRYLGDKKLPVSALELIDMTMAAITVLNDTNLAEIERIEQEWAAYLAQNPDKTPEQEAAARKKTATALTSRLSHLLAQRLTGDEPLPLENKLSLLKTWVAEPKTVTTPDDIAATVAYLTGIPMGKIQSEEQKNLLDMERLLEKRVVGQAHALKVVSEALRRSRAGLREANKPAAAFFFLGPTGTGKTELSKTIAEWLFNDPSALIRFDMSEFKEEHSAALLYGSPPGYIGYKEGGLLVNKIRQRPYSVVLFDEIEKAHKSVYDVFLQILDEGVIHDKQGKKGDFTKAIVIFTSNIGSEWIARQFQENRVPTREQLREIMADARMPDGSKAFRPELLGRGMHLIPFAPISEAAAFGILAIHLRNFAALLARQGIRFSWTEAAQRALIGTGFSPTYGARPLKDTIEDRIATPLSEQIILGNVSKGDHIELGWDGEAEKFLWEMITP